ncbi:hypothetical protein [Rubripirellula lacrimiformis]|nr:hypothetical protein [Rubripirellula lacrimiformis]
MKIRTLMTSDRKSNDLDPRIQTVRTVAGQQSDHETAAKRSPASVRWAASLLAVVAISTTAVADDQDSSATIASQLAAGGPDASGDASDTRSPMIFGSGAVNAQPKVVDGRFTLPPLEARSTATEDVGNGKIPSGFRGDQERPLQSLPESGADREQPWNWSVANWSAANTFAYPKYFEDRMLERHGHQRFGIAQPLVSGARFAATVPMLPYLMAIQPPCECEYTLGYYRSGSCAPMTFQRPPWDRRAIIAESAAVATGFVVIP